MHQPVISKMANYFLLLAVYLFGTVCCVHGQSVKAEYSTAKLPTPLLFSEPIFVRNDSIYLFGGSTGAQNTDRVLRYNISSDTIEELTQMPSYGYGGSTQRYDRKIYFFGGAPAAEPGQDFTDIVQFDPATNAAVSVGKLPLSVPFHTSFKDGNLAVGYFLFRNTDSGSTLYSCDLSTYKFEVIKEIRGFVGHSSILLGNSAHVFGLDTNLFEGQVLSIDLTSFETALVSSNAPYISGHTVTDGTSAYAFGADDGTGNPVDALIQFDLAANTWKVFDIENLLVDGHYSVPPSSVYAENYNRIYYFGGQTEDDASKAVQNRDDIWYVDLTPLSAA